MLEVAELEDGDFTQRECYLSFCFGQMLSIDEIRLKQGNKGASQATFTEFLESLGRVAELKTLAGYADSVPLSWKLKVLVEMILEKHKKVLSNDVVRTRALQALKQMSEKAAKAATNMPESMSRLEPEYLFS